MLPVCALRYLDSARATIAPAKRGFRTLSGVRIYQRTCRHRESLFSVKVLVIVEWIVGSKSVSIDSLRLLLMIAEKESHRRFIGGFRWDDVSLAAAMINEGEHYRFVPIIPSSSVFQEGTRARLLPALESFLSGRDVELVDLNRGNEVDGWCVGRSGELLYDWAK